MAKKIKEDGWNRFIEKGLKIGDENSNVQHEFSRMTKEFGISYLEYLKAAYEVKDEMTDEEFCKLNGGIPFAFLAKLSKI